MNAIRDGWEGRREAGDANPLVSIIIPTFNYARFLPEAIESALGQSYAPVEVVVVDDGSTDETPVVLAKRYAGKVRSIRQENQGLSAARNTGIRSSRGRFLVFLDADDILVPSMVDRMVRFLQAGGPDLGLVASRMALMDESGHPLPDRHPFSPEPVEIRLLDLLVMNRFGCAVLARREVFEACGGFDPGLRASEDRDMWIRVASRFRIVRLGEVLSRIRRHGENMSASGTRQADAIARIHRKAARAGYLRGWRRAYWLKIRAYYLYQRALLEVSISPARAIGRLLCSILLWPWFGDWRSLGQSRPWFRLRTLAWIALGRWKAS